jgi:large subunit ribosomal protein L4
VELVLSSEVHPYDLLRYEHAVFSKDAIEALQETLKKFVSKRGKTVAGSGNAAPRKEVA